LRLLSDEEAESLVLEFTSESLLELGGAKCNPA
jgi:hypothetical protein